jgi:NACHT domain
MSHSRPRYIVDQTWRLLMDTENPLMHLKPEYFRAGHSSVADGTLADWVALWLELEDHERVALDQVVDRNGKPISLHRLMITTDAGMGKSAAVQWLWYRINKSDSGKVAFRIDVRQLERVLVGTNKTARLITELASQWHSLCDEKLSADDAADYLQAFRIRGDIVLILDGLDQASGDVSGLQWLLTSDSLWGRCRIILAGRPHSIKHYASKLFTHLNWRYLRVEEFTDQQQQAYLGNMPDGRSRWHEIPEDARPILTVPRVLSYLRGWDDYSQIRSAADVYAKAVDHLIQGSMEQSAKACLIGPDVPRDEVPTVSKNRVRSAKSLLGLIAFETLVYYHEKPKPHPLLFQDRSNNQTAFQAEVHVTGPEEPVPEYNEGIDVGEFGDFERKLIERFDELKFLGSAGNSLIGLGWLNTVLEHGLLDLDCEGIDQIKFSNRSLHEFFVAYYLASDATEEDCRHLWNWLFLKDQTNTDAYYHIWQYLCEMPEECRNNRKWLNAIETLYLPAVQQTQDDGTTHWVSKRSTEMIYRSQLF